MVRCVIMWTNKNREESTHNFKAVAKYEAPSFLFDILLKFYHWKRDNAAYNGMDIW